MICPYCGKEIVEAQREHYFPQFLVNNKWDFWACRQCNYLKREHIVYPLSGLFKHRPAEFDFLKFKDLWKRAPMEKYLCIVPAKGMRASFDERKWVATSKIFTVEERIFYGLDRMQEIYFWAKNLIDNTDDFQALVINYSNPQMYLLHLSYTKYTTRYKEVTAVNLNDYVSGKMKGVIIYGSGRNRLWGCVSSYTDYFERLLCAPSSREILLEGECPCIM